MRDRFPAAFAIGIAVIAVAVGVIVYMQRGARVGVTGKIVKIRVAPLDENSSVVPTTGACAMSRAFTAMA